MTTLFGLLELPPKLNALEKVMFDKHKDAKLPGNLDTKLQIQI